jgi:hypothetical protein
MSPHFGLLDEAEMSREEALQMRAKLHWRGGKRRMIENKIPEAVATLYDALLSAMRWYVLTRHTQQLGTAAEARLEDDQEVIALLRRAGVIDPSFDLAFLEETVNKALLGQNLAGSTPGFFMDQTEKLLTRLELLPFAEEALPPEDPNTF